MVNGNNKNLIKYQLKKIFLLISQQKMIKLFQKTSYYFSAIIYYILNEQIYTKKTILIIKNNIF